MAYICSVKYPAPKQVILSSFLLPFRADYKTANDNEWDKSDEEEFKETDEH